MKKPKTNWKYWPSEQQKEAIRQQLNQHNFPILDLHAQHTGTCIPIRIGDCYFLATAAHVLNTRLKLDVIPRSDTKVPISKFKNKLVDNGADVGLLELYHPDAARCRDSFLHEDQILVGLGTRRLLPVAATGYPSDFIKQVGRVEAVRGRFLHFLALSSLTYRGHTLQASKWPSGFYERPPKRGRDIFVRLDPMEEVTLSHPKRAGVGSLKATMKMPSLRGISGGGIWLMAAKSSIVWRPHCSLIGIPVDAKQKENWLRGTLIDRWLALVEANYPGLRKTIAKIRRNKV